MDPAASMLKTKIFLFQMTDQGGLLLASVNRAGLFHPLRSISRERYPPADAGKDIMDQAPKPLRFFCDICEQEIEVLRRRDWQYSSSCSTSAWLISNIEPTFFKTFGLMRALLKTVTSLRRSSTRDDHIYCMKSDGIK